MAEFLKLCNIWSQDLVDKETLLQKAAPYIGSNPDLFAWLKRIIRYEPQPAVIQLAPEPPTRKVNLSSCRGYGPSYRLLPRRVSRSFPPLPPQ